MRPRQRAIKGFIQRWKRRHGQAVTFTKTTANSSINTTTWARTENETDVVIKKAVVFSPAKRQRDFVYDLAYIAAQKNFTEGGFFDHEIISVVFLASDIPSISDINMSDKFTIGTREFEIMNVSDYEVIAYKVRGKLIVSS